LHVASKIFTVSAQKRLFMHFMSKFWHHHWIQRPRHTCKRRIFRRSVVICHFWAIFSVRLRRNNIFTSGPKFVVINPSLSVISISYKRIEILTMFMSQRSERFWPHFHCPRAEMAICTVPVKILNWETQFPVREGYFGDWWSLPRVQQQELDRQKLWQTSTPISVIFCPTPIKYGTNIAQSSTDTVIFRLSIDFRV